MRNDIVPPAAPTADDPNPAAAVLESGSADGPRQPNTSASVELPQTTANGAAAEMTGVTYREIAESLLASFRDLSGICGPGKENELVAWFAGLRNRVQEWEVQMKAGEFIKDKL